MVLRIISLARSTRPQGVLKGSRTAARAGELTTQYSYGNRVHQLLTLKPPKSLPNSEQPQRSDPRLLEIHAGILLGSDALESGIHEHMPAGAGWVACRRQPEAR